MSRSSAPIRVFAVILLLAGSIPGIGQETGRKALGPVSGYHCLFMGHSFFAPIAKSLPDHTRACRIEGHEQTVVFHGGSEGAPGRLWSSTAADVAAAKKLIQTGTVDLIGLTFYPNVGSDISDYKRWVDFARQYNPTTRFFIMSPWAIKQDNTFAQYSLMTELCHGAIHQLIDALRTAYPGTVFFCIPEGSWMVNLWRMYDQKQLPEITEFEAKDRGRSGSTLFADHFGHGGQLAVREGALLWLAAIYNIDPRQCAWDTRTKADLKALAAEIIERDPYARNRPATAQVTQSAPR